LAQIVGLTGGAGDAKEIAMKARRPTSKDLLGVAISFRVAGHDLLVSHAQPLATPELAARYGAGRNRGLRTEPRASPWGSTCSGADAEADEPAIEAEVRALLPSITP